MELNLKEYKAKYIPTKHVQIDSDTREVVLGRHPDNALCLRSVSISRRHVVIKQSANGYDLHEQKAVNRVHLNDNLLPAGAIVQLNNHDEIQLGIKPDPSSPATANSEYFVYRFTTNLKRKGSQSPSTSTKRFAEANDCNETAARLASVEAATKLAKDAAVAQLAAEAAKLAEAEAAAKLAEAEATARLVREEEEAKAAKAEAEKKALENELIDLRQLQDAQKAAMAAREVALRQEMADLQSKQETAIKSIQDEQSKMSEEISKKLEEREKELEEAKAHEKKLEALEQELKSTREEQETLRLLDVQKKITDLLEDQLQCTICSELMIKPKNFLCSHTFCGFCIDKWLEKKKECPVCRSRVTAATPNYQINSLLEKAIEELSDESRANRQSVIAAREAELAAKNNAKNKKGKKKQPPNRRQRNNATGTSASTSASGSRSQTSNRPTTTTASNAPTPGTSNQPITASSSQSSAPGAAAADAEEVIVLSSDSDFERTLSSDTDTSEYSDGWYTGVPGGVYEGYGHCFNCGDPGHWRPDCPYL